MIANRIVRSVKLPAASLPKLMRSGVIDRATVVNNNTSTISATLPYALRINRISDMEVLVEGEWTFVKNNSPEAVEDAYREIVHFDYVPEVVTTYSEEIKSDDKVETPVVEETHIDTIIDTNPEIVSDVVEEVSNTIEESSEIVEDAVELSNDEESDIDSDEEYDDSEDDVQVEQTSDNNQQNYNGEYPRYSVKKKKRRH